LVWWLSMMTLWTGFKQQNFASDESIGPNEVLKYSCAACATVLTDPLILKLNTAGN